MDSNRSRTSDCHDWDDCHIYLDWCWTPDTEIPCQTLSDDQYHAGIDLIGMCMEYAESVDFKYDKRQGNRTEKTVSGK